MNSSINVLLVYLKEAQNQFKHFRETVLFGRIESTQLFHLTEML